MGIDYKFDLMLSEDGSGRGAALVAAVLKRGEEEEGKALGQWILWFKRFFRIFFRFFEFTCYNMNWKFSFNLLTSNHWNETIIEWNLIISGLYLLFYTSTVVLNMVKEIFYDNDFLSIC